MKRIYTMSEDEIFETSLSDALCKFNKRNKPDAPNLVSDPKLAEKVEPGYLIKLASEIENVNDFVFHSACGKLKLIEEQMAVLKQQAVQILVETKINSILNSLPCNFSKKVGHVYSVYEKSDGMYYFSMISPEEWGSSCPHKYIGSFKLENSLIWNPVDEMSHSAALRCWVQKNARNNVIQDGIDL